MTMTDVVFVVLVTTFFGLASLLVRACEHIVGEAQTVDVSPPPATDGESVTA